MQPNDTPISSEPKQLTKLIIPANQLKLIKMEIILFKISNNYNRTVLRWENKIPGKRRMQPIDTPIRSEPKLGKN